MKYLISFILFLCASGLIAYDQLNLGYWSMAPEKRVDQKWQKEVQKAVSSSKKLQTALFLIKSIETTTTDQQFKDLIDKSKLPFTKAQQGKYDLKIQILPWILDMKYGYLIQHELFDEANNKVYEFNSDIEIGRLW